MSELDFFFICGVVRSRVTHRGIFISFVYGVLGHFSDHDRNRAAGLPGPAEAAEDPNVAGPGGGGRRRTRSRPAPHLAVCGVHGGHKDLVVCESSVVSD